MKAEPCQICEGREYDLYLGRVYVWAERTFDLVRCRRCGLVKVEPMLKPEEARQLYTEEYFQRDFSCGVRKGTYLESEAMRVSEYREILNLVQIYRPSGKLLEVGCAAGSFLSYAQRLGYEVEGVDLSAWASQIGAEQFGVQVRVGRLMEVGYPAESFEVVFAGDLLEHEPEPAALVREMARVLKPNGIVALKVPTYVNSFYFRLARRFPWSWLRGWLDLRLLQAMKLSHQGPKFPPYHLYEFSRRNLFALCEKAGLRVIGHWTSLLVPEFLDSWNASALDRMVYYGFVAMKRVVVRLNLPAGHVLVLAEKG